MGLVVNSTLSLTAYAVMWFTLPAMSHLFQELKLKLSRAFYTLPLCMAAVMMMA